ncbi:MAG: L,D-transpeptidase family protein [Thermodesulfobacteriota bacterium]
MKKLLFKICLFIAAIIISGTSSHSSTEKANVPESIIVVNETKYSVKDGDNLKKIASSFNVSPEELIKTNKLRNAATISPGQTLKIYERIIVPQTIENGLIINLPEYKIYHFELGKLKNSYKIAIGKKSWKTPTGGFEIANKSLDPTWIIPPGIAGKLKNENSTVPPGPDNPLGKYWIGLSLPHIGIHSTNEPVSIGKAKSHGCMRMYTDEAERLFNNLEVGIKGEIIYKPVKVAYKNGDIFLEVHEDIYNLVPDLLSHTTSLLQSHGLYSKVDLETVKAAVNEKNGTPVRIGSSFGNNAITELDNVEEKQVLEKENNNFNLTEPTKRPKTDEAATIWGSSN